MTPFRTCPALILLLSLAGMAGCGGATNDAPPPAEEVATPSPSSSRSSEPDDPSFLLPSELRRRLGVSETNTSFERIGGCIESVVFERSGVKDLAPMQGIRLRGLEMSGERISDLSPLASDRLERLFLVDTDVSDLSPFQGAPIQLLAIERSPVADIPPVITPTMEQVQLVDVPISGSRRPKSPT